MTDDSKTVLDEMKALRESYAAELPVKFSSIDDAWEAFDCGKGDPEQLESMYRMVHDLAGSGSTFGLKDLSIVARNLEMLIKDLIDNGHSLSQEHLKNIKSLMTELHSAAVGSKELGEELGQVVLKTFGERKNRRVFIVEDDKHFAKELDLQLRHAGYEVSVFDTTEKLKENVEKTLPAAILMDIIFPHGKLAGIEAIIEIQHDRESLIPVIFISKRDDMEARLNAARAGGMYYFTKPFDVDNLVQALDELTAERIKEPYRVLIVDDDASLAKLYSFALERAGMLTSVVNDPMQALERIAEFKPELILMDVYMPNCKGTELAVVIRQRRRYIDVPIVFLSAETDFDKQMAALNLGGDDFLNKSLDINSLVKMITPRVKRARILNTLARELQDSERKYRGVVDNINIGIVLVDRDMKILSLNPQIQHWFPQLYQGAVWDNIFNDLSQDDNDLDLPWILCLRDSSVHEAIIKKVAEDSVKHYRVVSSPILDEKDEVVNMIQMIEDITERVQAHEALRDSEERYRQVVDNASDIIYGADDSGYFTFFNPTALKTMGYSREELLGKHFLDLIRPDRREDSERLYVSQVVEKIPNTYYEFPAIAKDEKEIWMGQNVQLVMKDDKVMGIQAVARDITDRIMAEKALQEAKDYIENIINSMADSLIVIKPDLTINFINRATCELLGYTEQELSERSIDHIFYGGVSFEKTLFGEIMEKGFVKNPEMLYMNKSNQKIPVSFLGTAMYEDAERKKNPVGIICIAHDMRAIEELQKKVRHAEKMAATGVLSAGVAHEIKNPLAIIIQGLESLKFSLSSIPENALIQDTIGRIRKAALRADKIVKGLSDFSRQTSMTFEKLDIHKVIEETISLVGQQFNLKDIKIIRQFSPDLEKIGADNDRIKQVFINLLINAVEAMPGGGMITISTQLYEPRSEEKYLNITFADTGCGISEESMQKVFEPFYTTKTKTLSTGLGLSITRGIIEKHDGNIEIESEMGKGAKVVISLVYNPTLIESKLD